jgi:FKBP-type peptidyl-prolyl cis-trans isomerase FkpA
MISAANLSRHRCLACVAAAILLVPSATTLAQAPASAPNALQSKMGANVTNLEKIDSTVGTGAEAIKGKTVVVHYTGWLYDPNAADKKGKKFDSSRDRPTPFSFALGSGQVIAGWDEGVPGMRVGGKRTLIIPSYMAYGRRGAGGDVIPPDATLIFEVELLEVKG